MATTLHFLNKHNDTGVAQLHITADVTPNGATPVTLTYTYPRAFAEIPKIIGVNHSSAASLVASARSSATVLTIQVVGLSGNTTPTVVSVALEGKFAEGT